MAVKLPNRFPKFGQLVHPDLSPLNALELAVMGLQEAIRGKPKDWKANCRADIAMIRRTIRAMKKAKGPRALLTVSGGCAELHADLSIVVHFIDYDNTPNAKVPAAFRNLPAVGL